MTPLEVSALFRAYIDEPDQTFVDDAIVQSFLDQGYTEFREFITAIDPHVYAKTRSITIAGQLYDLIPDFMGPAPAVARVTRILSIFRASDMVPLTRVGSFDALNATPDSFFLSDTSLIFSRTINDTYTMLALGEHPIVWTTPPGASVFLDDFYGFHDVIALMASRQYAIIDGADNPQIERQLGLRLAKLEQFVRERTSAGPFYVQLVTL